MHIKMLKIWLKFYFVKSIFFSLSSKPLIDFVRFEAASTSRAEERESNKYGKVIAITKQDCKDAISNVMKLYQCSQVCFRNGKLFKEVYYAV